MFPLSARATLSAALLSLGLALLGHSLAAPLTYQVQRGDTAYSVAKRFGLTVDALLALNGLASTDLKAGQTLTVGQGEVAASPAPLLAATPFVATAPQAERVRLVQGAAGLVPPGAPPAPVAATPAAPSPTDADRYQVQRGDTAYSVAKRFGLTVDALLALNGLASTDLKAGQTLTVRPTALVARAPQGGPAAGVPVQSAAATALLTQAPVSVPGQPSSIAVTPVAPSSPADAPALLTEPLTTTAPAVPDLGDPAGVALLNAGPLGSVRERASHLLGLPYLYGGTGAQGVDCSGLVVQVFSGLGVRLPRRSADQYGAGQPVDRSGLSEGDLVFFDTEGRGQVTHVGIYIGQNFFVHANSYDGRVTVNRLSERYYDTRYLGARRVLGPQALNPASLMGAGRP